MCGLRGVWQRLCSLCPLPSAQVPLALTRPGQKLPLLFPGWAGLQSRATTIGKFVGEEGQGEWVCCLTPTAAAFSATAAVGDKLKMAFH